MRRLGDVVLWCALLLVGFGLSASSAEATVRRAASPAYNDVLAAVAAATSGDVVEVPEGSATWSNTLSIDKRIWLQGSGIGKTVITGNVGPSAFMVTYEPTDAPSSAFFRLTGFTFDSANNSQFLKLARSKFTTPSYVRIDHNRFVGGTSNTTGWTIRGMIYGVVDNNVFENRIHLDNYGLGATAWATLKYIPGSAENLYYEDNAFNVCYTLDTGGHGGRYASRYNTYILSAPCNGLSGYYPLHDAHGNQQSGVVATMGVELYGNKVQSAHYVRFLDHRGGKAMVFFNKVETARAGIQVREEYPDSISLPAEATDGTPQHVNNSYYWNNRAGSTTGVFNGEKSQDLTPPVLTEGAQYFNHKVLNDGTGVGCGTLASRPATCSPGAGYWATTQSCSAVDDENIGANPKVPLSGTLYQCTAERTWTPYFTPYTYPHPFRLGPSAPTQLRVW